MKNFQQLLLIWYVMEMGWVRFIHPNVITTGRHGAAAMETTVVSSFALIQSRKLWI